MSHNKEPIEIETWLVTSISNLLEKDPEEIEPTVSLESYGLDSSAAITLSGDLQEWLGCNLDPSIFFDYPTIEAITEYLSKEENFPKK